jgi:predicted MPP superfamily phosphohydrolase
VDLMLSGHTHAGQFFPFVVFVYIIWHRPRRLYEYKGSHLYVTPGVGTWGPPLRLGSSPEITLLRLTSG